MTKNEMVNMVILVGNTIAERADDIVGKIDNTINDSEIYLEATIKGNKDEGFTMEISSHAERR